MPIETFSAHDFLHVENWEQLLDSPGVWDTPKTHFFLTPSRILGFELYNLGVDSHSGRTTAKAGNGTYQRNTHFIDCFRNSIRKSTHEPLRLSPLLITSAGLWVPPSSPRHIHTQWLPPCACPWGQEWSEWAYADVQWACIETGFCGIRRNHVLEQSSPP